MPTLRNKNARAVLRAVLMAAVAGVLCLWGCKRQGEAEQGTQRAITVFAAASTTEALGEIAAQFRRDTGIEVRLNFAASSTLASQIEAGRRPTSSCRPIRNGWTTSPSRIFSARIAAWTCWAMIWCWSPQGMGPRL